MYVSNLKLEDIDPIFIFKLLVQQMVPTSIITILIESIYIYIYIYLIN